MPTRPPRLCNRCQRPYTTARCEPCHAAVRQIADQRRGSARQRGYTGEWEKARLAYLREHPLCRICEGKGRVVSAAVVDHVVPHRGHPGMFWDQQNWQALCKPCHDIKTAKEDGGFGNEPRRNGEAEKRRSGD